MVISSTKRPTVPKTPPAKPPQEPVEQTLPGEKAAEWADMVKRRSTLTNLVEPAGVVIGYLSNPLLNLQTLAEGGKALIKGDFGGTGKALGTLVERGYNPKGVGGALYNSAQAIQAATGAVVGGLEVYAGIKSKYHYLTMMGGADLLGAASNTALLMNLDGAAVGLSIASTVGKTALVLAKPDKFTRTQKVKTILDSSGAVASSMLKSGFLVVPALGVSAVAGIGQVAYMNHDGFRDRVDKLLDKIFGKKNFFSRAEPQTV